MKIDTLVESGVDPIALAGTSLGLESPAAFIKRVGEDKGIALQTVTGLTEVYEKTAETGRAFIPYFCRERLEEMFGDKVVEVARPPAGRAVQRKRMKKRSRDISIRRH